MGKHTHYFATYADAYNYYPNGIPSTEIAIVGDASYVFVSSDNSYSGNTTFFDANMTNDEIVDTMNETAYNAGTTYGYEVGFDEGYDDGYDEGFADGVDSVPTPEGNIDITTTSQYDVTTYATAQIADANLIAGNIANGVTILGVTGSYTGGSGIQPSGTYWITDTNQADVTNYSYAQISVMSSNLSPANIKYGETVLGVVGEYTGSGIEPSGTIYISDTMIQDVTYYQYAQVNDMNLIASNIANGVTILGVTGTYTGGGSAPTNNYAIANQASTFIIAYNGNMSNVNTTYYENPDFQMMYGYYLQTSYNNMFKYDKITDNGIVSYDMPVSFTNDNGAISIENTSYIQLNEGDSIGIYVDNYTGGEDPMDMSIYTYWYDYSKSWLSDSADLYVNKPYMNGHWLTASYTGNYSVSWYIGTGIPTFSFTYVQGSTPTPQYTCPTCNGTCQVWDEPTQNWIPCPTCNGTGYVDYDPTPVTPDPEPASNGHYETCASCGGLGFFPAAIEGEDPVMCAQCGGTGQIWVEDTTPVANPCATCGGTGTIIDTESGETITCPDCGGTGLV